VEKIEGKKPLGRPRVRWEDNIKMDIREVGCGVMDLMDLAQYRDRLRALVNGENFLSSCKPVSFSRKNRFHGLSNEVSIWGSVGTAPCILNLE